MPKAEERIVCKTPTKGKKPTRIAKWKYDAIRAAIRRVVPKTGPGVPFSSLTGLVKADLPPDVGKEIGVLMWYVTTVKLNMEVVGELERVTDAKPQRLRRVK